jgi:hypothetical protein
MLWLWCINDEEDDEYDDDNDNDDVENDSLHKDKMLTDTTYLHRILFPQVCARHISKPWDHILGFYMQWFWL